MNDIRVGKTVRLAPSGWKAVGKIAEREQRSEADAIRLMLKYASANMPKGWTGT